MTELEGYILELALELDFKMTNDDGDVFECTEAQVLEFAARVGRASARTATRDLTAQLSSMTHDRDYWKRCAEQKPAPDDEIPF